MPELARASLTAPVGGSPGHRRVRRDDGSGPELEVLEEGEHVAREGGPVGARVAPRGELAPSLPQGGSTRGLLGIAGHARIVGWRHDQRR